MTAVILWTFAPDLRVRIDNTAISPMKNSDACSPNHRPPKVEPFPFGRANRRDLQDFFSCCTIEICLFLSNDGYSIRKSETELVLLIGVLAVGRPKQPTTNIRHVPASGNSS